MFPLLDFLAEFWMPLVCALAAIVGAAINCVLRDDAPRTEWPREEQ